MPTGFQSGRPSVGPPDVSPCDYHAWTLYLFLVTVADAQGLSYYSDAGVCRRLPDRSGDPLGAPGINWCKPI